MLQVISIFTLIVLLCSTLVCPAESTDRPHSTLIEVLHGDRQSTIDLYNCNGVRNRRDIRDLSPTEVQEWQSIISNLIVERDSSTDTSFWDTLVQVHIAFTTEAHRGSYFLPWHRLFLLVLENAIRGRGFPNFALPYWDWSVDADDAALSELWSPFYIGGATQNTATNGPLPIPNGPFAGTTARFPTFHTVLRNFSSGVPGGMRELVGEPIIDLIVNLTTFASFAINTELAHDIVHVGIGGDMGVVNSAPNDPVFYLHHAFVDSIYSRRQAIYGVNDFGGVHNFPGNPQPANPNFEFQTFGRTASEGFDTPCVNYLPYSGSSSSIRLSKGQKKAGPNLSILWDACKNSKIRMGIPRRVCMKAVRDLQKSMH